MHSHHKGRYKMSGGKQMAFTVETWTAVLNMGLDGKQTVLGVETGPSQPPSATQYYTAWEDWGRAW